MIRKIWMCWFQGEDDPDMPSLNRECIKRWREFNQDKWEVNVLTEENIHEHIPEYYRIVNSYHNPFIRTYTNKSDLLRALLLDKYGGVWVDASVYPMMPLDEFYDKLVNDTGFFTYRFLPRRKINKKWGNRETVSWFFCADRPEHYLISRLKYGLVNRYLINGNYKYFSVSDVICDLYDSDEKSRDIIDNMVQLSEQIPHSALESWDDRAESYLYKRPALFEGNKA